MQRFAFSNFALSCSGLDSQIALGSVSSMQMIHISTGQTFFVNHIVWIRFNEVEGNVQASMGMDDGNKYDFEGSDAGKIYTQLKKILELPNGLKLTGSEALTDKLVAAALGGSGNIKTTKTVVSGNW